MNVQPHGAPRRSLWIPWVFVGGMLLVVAVNGVMVWAALSTFTGVTVGRAYERGRGYDAVLAEAVRQDALGWSAELRLAEGVLHVMARDRDGRPLTGRLEGVLRRPLEGTDLPLDPRATGAGQWEAAAQLPRAGQWEARLTLWGADGRNFDIRRRLVVP